MIWKPAVCIRTPNSTGDSQFVILDDLKAAENHPAVQEWCSKNGPTIVFSDVKVCSDCHEIIVDFGKFKMRIDQDKV